MDFKSFFKSGGRDTRRHMRPISRVTKKHPGKYVPTVHKTDATENIKYTKIKDGTSRREFLSHKDIHELQKRFKFTPSIKKPVKLGNTGIEIRYTGGKFVMMKA